eukprot:m.303525 g.303525  ORF g.303525 m.303525 type:complete len:206 (-) comp20167_c1_seq1:127-744(-)
MSSIAAPLVLLCSTLFMFSVKVHSVTGFAQQTCADNNTAFAQWCQNRNPHQCKWKACDTFVANLVEAGENCSSLAYPPHNMPPAQLAFLEQTCCRSCTYPAQDPVVLKCNENNVMCRNKMEGMGLSCCEGMSPLSSASSRTNKSVASCITCAKSPSIFGNNTQQYQTCSCCVEGLVREIFGIAGGPELRKILSWATQVFVCPQAP